MLRRAIADGTYPPGTPTPSITTLSQQYGYARQTCAKALRVLVTEGLLIRYPGLGYYVAGTPRPENPASNSDKPDAPVETRRSGRSRRGSGTSAGKGRDALHVVVIGKRRTREVFQAQPLDQQLFARFPVNLARPSLVLGG